MLYVVCRRCNLNTLIFSTLQRLTISIFSLKMALRKGTAFFFTIILLLNLGYNGILGIMVLYAKHSAYLKIYQQSSAPSFERMSIPLRRARELEGKEYWLNGRLYDLRKKEIKNDSVILTLYHDQHEESLVSAIRDFFGADNTYFFHTNETCIHIHSQLYNQDQISPDIRNWKSAEMPVLCFCRDFRYHNMLPSFYLTIPSPPPRA